MPVNGVSGFTAMASERVELSGLVNKLIVGAP
jgi:hypothetical protein